MIKSVHIKNRNFILHPERVLIDKENEILVLSDLHLGYYASLRTNGSYLPKYDSDLLNKRLTYLVEEYKEFHWILTGDIKHSHYELNNLNEDELYEINSGLEIISQVEKLDIIKGNHDNGLEEIIKNNGFSYNIHNELKIGSLIFSHDGENVERISINDIIIFGHIHPIIRIKSIKAPIPIFAISSDTLILPSFNMVAGGYDFFNYTNSGKNWQCYGILESNVVNLGQLDVLKNEI